MGPGGVSSVLGPRGQADNFLLTATALIYVLGLEWVRKSQFINDITKFVSSDKQDEFITYVSSMYKEPTMEDVEDKSNEELNEEDS
ncbi:hypothetical protein RvY_02010 [Ramazzottius varieornatus]|uniref:Uncharacterized protein n=1 Tax=Ramazzottius varieornatus TaxID=947166 RepID=A0A1D1UJ45_RAMVA|nr:hypothetical protein RvY_02010 [Ramazzottius varieornatus]